jgi:hypothetical protein
LKRSSRVGHAAIMNGTGVMRVFALSDIHVDYPENMAWIRGLSDQDYIQDVLLLAGDVCHEMSQLQTALTYLLDKFAYVFFLTGNHELWLLDGQFSDSLQKFQGILDLCRSLGVRTEPARLGHGSNALWIVPMFSWYVKPEEGKDSLYLPKRGASGNLDETRDAWADDYLVKWPAGGKIAEYFLARNIQVLPCNAPVISFSHFLPRSELMFHIEAGPLRTSWPSPAGFNFSRVAGTSALDEQIRKLDSRVHVYGHQHRNRWRWVEGVLYVSHCLGYPHERKPGRVGPLGEGPKLIWEGGRVAQEASADPVI